MKKITISIILTTALKLYSASPGPSEIYTPYFDMSLTEAGYLPSNGNIFSGAVIDTRAGFLLNLAERHGLFVLYSFNYSGPGFSPQDTKQFTDRSMSHSFNMEYRYKINDMMRLRPAFNFGNSYRRMGANESWENGLYNNKNIGGQISFDYTFDADNDGSATLSILSRIIKFPNYTDLLLEFQNPGAAAEVGGGLYDQNMTQYSLRSSWHNLFGGFLLTFQKYKKQKVIESNGTYGSANQKDTDTSMDIGIKQRFWIFDLYPSLVYTIHSSNQNFMRYKSSVDTNPVFVKDAYSYKELSFVLPLDLNITSKWAIGGSLATTKRTYDSRPPRGTNNDYIVGKKQVNTFSTATVSIKKMINEVAYVKLFYTITKASSNNKFEAYIPYNYTGSSFGLTYGIMY
ncbi:MAG: hypothetical protein ACP5IO_03330 [Elusimicrobiales bacterium]